MRALRRAVKTMYSLNCLHRVKLRSQIRHSIVDATGQLHDNVSSARCCLPVLAIHLYMMLSTCISYPPVHDAVYLYLRTVNQTVAEGNSDRFRDGRYIRNKTVGQRFVGRVLNAIRPTLCLRKRPTFDLL